MAFAASGILTSVAGVLLASKLRIRPRAIVGLEVPLPALVGTFLGSTTIRPGRIDVWGTAERRARGPEGVRRPLCGLARDRGAGVDPAAGCRRSNLVTADNIACDGDQRNVVDPDNGYLEAYKKIWAKPWRPRGGGRTTLRRGRSATWRRRCLARPWTTAARRPKGCAPPSSIAASMSWVAGVIGHLRTDGRSKRPLHFRPAPPFAIADDARTRLVIRILYRRRDIPAAMR